MEKLVSAVPHNQKSFCVHLKIKQHSYSLALKLKNRKSADKIEAPKTHTSGYMHRTGWGEGGETQTINTVFAKPKSKINMVCLLSWRHYFCWGFCKL